MIFKKIALFEIPVVEKFTNLALLGQNGRKTNPFSLQYLHCQNETFFLTYDFNNTSLYE